MNRILWCDWLDGFWEIDEQAMWVNALFELAWQRIPGSPLSARKFAWHGTTTVPLEALPHLRKRGNLKRELANIPDPPVHWYSVIENLPAASVAAVDMLLAFGDEIENQPSERLTSNEPIAKSTADIKAKRTQSRPPSFEELDRKTPALDTESVEWIAATQENKEKLGLPVETLRTYRLASSGGRKMPDKMFGVDHDGRCWRRQGTPTSRVYYYAPSLAKASNKASN